MRFWQGPWREQKTLCLLPVLQDSEGRGAESHSAHHQLLQAPFGQPIPESQGSVPTPELSKDHAASTSLSPGSDSDLSLQPRS